MARLLIIPSSFRWQGFPRWLRLPGFPRFIIYHLSFSVALLLTSCDPGRHERMQQQLAALQALNRADSVLTDDSLAQALADYFDRHGTPNEQMEAHYLLGRTHADRGEAPAALAAYHDAIDRADTTATDCNYRQLCRVYAQMADIFYDQNLMDDNLEYLERAVSAALKGCDTIIALNMLAYKTLAYERTNRPECVLKVYDEVKRGLCDRGYIQDAAAFSSLAIGSYLKCGRLEEARKCMEFYESASGYFTEDGSIETGREAYYYLRGMYHLSVQEFDSACYFFRKELNEGRDYNCQNSASRGLALLFQQTGQPDSSAKYALYSYEMNDSLYAQKTTHDVERMHQMYNYGWHQKAALIAEQRSEAAKTISLILTFLTIGVCVASAIIMHRIFQKRREEHRQYNEAVEKLDMLTREQKTLEKQMENLALLRERDMMNVFNEEQWRKQEAELKHLIVTKEKETERLKAKIAKFKCRHTSSLGKNHGYTDNMMSETYTLIKQLAERREKITDSEWERIMLLVSSERPELYRFVNSNKSLMGINGSRICLLLCYPVRVKETANMMGVKPSYISKLSSEILKMTGSSKELKQVLEEMCDTFEAKKANS